MVILYIQVVTRLYCVSSCNSKHCTKYPIEGFYVLRWWLYFLLRQCSCPLKSVCNCFPTLLHRSFPLYHHQCLNSIGGIFLQLTTSQLGLITKDSSHISSTIPVVAISLCWLKFKLWYDIWCVPESFIMTSCWTGSKSSSVSCEVQLWAYLRWVETHISGLGWMLTF